jgi:hypothetical protein
MRPKVFDFQFLALRIRLLRKRQQLHTGGESPGNIAVNLTRNFSTAALRLHHAGQRYEFAPCFRIANGPVSCPGAGSSPLPRLLVVIF